MLEKFIENFLIKSRVHQQEIGEHVLAGRCKEHTDYRHAIGRLKGFKEADDLVRSLYKAMVDRVDFSHYREISNGSEPESY